MNDFGSLTAKEKALITYKEIKKRKAAKKKKNDDVLYGYLAENGNTMRKRNKRNNHKYRVRGQ